MTQFVKLAVGDSDAGYQRTILVEVEHAEGEGVKSLVSNEDVIEKFDQTFDALIQNEIVQNCKVLVGAFQELATLPLKPKTAHVEFGLQFTAEGNIYVVKSSAQASYTVSFDWDFSDTK